MTPLNRAQFLCFVLVWFSYASTYLLRKPLGVVKADLGAELGVSADGEEKQHKDKYLSSYPSGG